MDRRYKRSWEFLIRKENPWDVGALLPLREVVIKDHIERKTMMFFFVYPLSSISAK